MTSLVVLALIAFTSFMMNRNIQPGPVNIQLHNVAMYIYFDAFGAFWHLLFHLGIVALKAITRKEPLILPFSDSD